MISHLGVCLTAWYGENRVGMRVAGHSRPRRIWALAFLGFFLAGAAWAFASPYDGASDEVQHIIRAAGVVQGQIAPKLSTGNSHFGGTGGLQTVPKGLVQGIPRPGSNYCYHRRPAQSAACAPVPGKGGHTLATFQTGAGRYNPLYYAAVGGPLVLWPDWTGILLARLASAALCSAFLASAWLSCIQWRRSPLLLAGLLVAATPAFFELSGAINPNSLEIAASISLAAAAIPLLLDQQSLYVQGWLRRAAVAAIGICQFRALGPGMVAGLLFVLLVPPVRARLRQLARLLSARWWAAGVGISAIVGVWWTTHYKAGQIGHYTTAHYAPSAALHIELTSRLPVYLVQMVDGFGAFYDTHPPALIFVVWASALGVLLVNALALGDRTGRWRLAVLILGTLAMAPALELSTVNTFGFSFQGRYILPLAVAIPLLAAYIAGRDTRYPPMLQVAAIRASVVVLLPLQLFSLGYVMDRWQSGIGPGHTLNPLNGTWHPVVGSALPLLSMTAGLVILGVMAWRAVIPDQGEHVPQVSQSPAHVEVPSA
jgi:hypothetical protein